jgi:DNA gyrase inhibitor GyrI
MNKMESSDSNRTLEIKGVKVLYNGIPISTLREMVNTLQDSSRIIYYDQEKNQDYKIDSTTGTNRFFLPGGIEYCRLGGGNYAVIYATQAQRTQEKRNFKTLYAKLSSQSTERLRQKQCPIIWTEFEYEDHTRQKRYGLYLKAKKRILGQTDQIYMDNGVILAPGAYLSAHEQLERASGG